MRIRVDQQPPRRSGAILVLLVFSMMGLLAFVAMAIDQGVIIAAHSELQGAADAAAIAGAAQLLDRDELTGSPDQAGELREVREQARRLALSNRSWNVFLDLDLNETNHIDGDIVAGYLADPSNLDCEMTFNTVNPPEAHIPTLLYTTSALGLNIPYVTPPRPTDEYVSYNSVRVRVQRTEKRNGSLGLYFGQALGRDSIDLSATATATYEDNIIGFDVPRGDLDRRTGGPACCKLLPFALDINTFANVAAGRSWLDLYRYDPNGPAFPGHYPYQPPDYADRIRFAYPGLDTYVISREFLSHPSLNPVVPALGREGALGLVNNSLGYVVNTTYNPNDLLNPGKALDQIFPGDDIAEGLMIPMVLQTQLLGKPFSLGNFGTLYIGTNAHTPLSEFQRQILWGVNADDLAKLDQPLKLGQNGTLTMKGDTLVVEALKETLGSIRGQPRIIPLFRPKPQPILGQLLGRNMEYEIVGFGGIVIIEVLEVPATPELPAIKNPLTGQVVVPGVPAGPKTLKVLFQPEFVIDRYAVGGGAKLLTNSAKTSRFVYRPLRLTR